VGPSLPCGPVWAASYAARGPSADTQYVPQWQAELEAENWGQKWRFGEEKLSHLAGSWLTSSEWPIGASDDRAHWLEVCQQASSRAHCCSPLGLGCSLGRQLCGEAQLAAHANRRTSDTSLVARNWPLLDSVHTRQQLANCPSAEHTVSRAAKGGLSCLLATLCLHTSRTMAELSPFFPRACPPRVRHLNCPSSSSSGSGSGSGSASQGPHEPAPRPTRAPGTKRRTTTGPPQSPGSPLPPVLVPGPRESQRSQWSGRQKVHCCCCSSAILPHGRPQRRRPGGRLSGDYFASFGGEVCTHWAPTGAAGEQSQLSERSEWARNARGQLSWHCEQCELCEDCVRATKVRAPVCSVQSKRPGGGSGWRVGEANK